MQGIQAILQNKSQLIEKKSKLTTPHQVEAFETAEILNLDIKKNQKELRILLRLAKSNPGIFNRTRLFMYGLKSDGYTSKCCIGYFLAMYKIYNKEKK